MRVIKNFITQRIRILLIHQRKKPGLTAPVYEHDLCCIFG
jgi:hypothetical protein